MIEIFNVGHIRQYRDGLHCPSVLFDGEVLMMMGRRIPVRSEEDLRHRLRLINCHEEVVEMIVGGLFGYRIATETSVAALKFAEAEV